MAIAARRQRRHAAPDLAGQPPDGRLLKDGGQRELQPLCLREGEDLNASNRIASQAEKVVIDADRLPLQDLLPDLHENALLARNRRLVADACGGPRLRATAP